MMTNLVLGVLGRDALLQTAASAAAEFRDARAEGKAQTPIRGAESTLLDRKKNAASSTSQPPFFPLVFLSFFIFL